MVSSVLQVFFLKRYYLFCSFHIGLNVGLSAAASQCFLASMTVVASLCDCSSKLRNMLLSSTKIVDLLLRQLRELRLILQFDQVMKCKCYSSTPDRGLKISWCF